MGRGSSGRIRLILLCLVAAALLIAVGCGGGQETTPDPAPTPSEPSEPTEETAAGGEVTVGITRTGVSSLDASVTNSRFDRFFIANIYDRLIWQEEAGVFLPGLATEWEYNDDFTLYRLTLRDDIVLTDGTPFTADLLVYNVEHILTPDVGSYRTALFNDMVRNEAVEDYVWEIEFSTPQYRFMDILSEDILSPNSPDAIERLGRDYNRTPVTTGPYIVEDWPDEMTMVLVKNEDWKPASWMDDSWGPFLDKITIRFIPEAATASVALERGEIDIVYNPPMHEVPALRDSGNYSVEQYFSAGLPQGLNINVSRAPTNDLALRRAMFYGVDKEEINLLAFHGVERAAYSTLSTNNWAFWEPARDMYPYDPEKARETLEEGGWVMNDATGYYEKDGQRSIVRIVTTGGEAHEIVERRWREVGIEATLESMAYEATEVRYAANDYEVARLGLSGVDPAGPLRGAFHSENVDAGSHFNRSKFSDPWMDDMLAKGEATFDTDERRAIYQEIQEFTMDQALFLPLFENSYIWVFGDTLHGFEFNRRGDPHFMKVTIQE